MANIFELNINLNRSEKSEAEKALEKTINGDTSSSNNDDDSLKTAVKAAGTNYFIREGLSNVVSPVVNLQLSTYGTIYGDQARQNKISNMANLSSKAMDGVSAGLAGYSAATALGASGPWGAIIAVAMEAFSMAIDLYDNYRQYNENQLNYMYNANYTQERLGILASSKGR